MIESKYGLDNSNNSNNSNSNDNLQQQDFKNDSVS
jgi:hypothetical protein